MKHRSQKLWVRFREDFRNICVSHFGIEHPKGLIYEQDAAFQIPTPLGLLNASIHWDGERITKCRSSSGSVYTGGIYLRFESYTGPRQFPLHGDFNDYSHKWNIHYASNDLEYTFSLCLGELKLRLEILMKEESNA